MPCLSAGMLAALFFLSLPCRGEEAEGRGPRAAAAFPADTALFVSFPSLGRAWKGFESLPLYRAYEDEEVQAFLDSFGEELEELAPGISLDRAKRLLDLPSIFEAEAAFGLRFPEEKGKEDEVRWLLTLRAEEDRERAGRFVEEVLLPLARSFFPFGPERERVAGVEVSVLSGPLRNLYVCFAEGRLVLSTDRGFMEAFLAAKAEAALAGTPAFREAREQWVKDAPSFVVYATLSGLWRRAAREMTPEEGAVLRASGFDGLDYFYAALAMEGGRARETVHLHVPGEKRGFFTVFSGDPVDRSTTRLAPDNALVFLQANLDPGALYRTVLAMGEASKEKDFRNFRTMVDGLAGRFGLRSFSDLVGLLGTEFLCYAALPRGGGGLIPEAMLALEVLEPDRLQAHLAGVVETLAGRPAKRTPYRNRTIFYLPLEEAAFLDLHLCWCVTDGYLLLGLHPSVLKGVIRRLDTEKGTLAEDPPFEQAWKGLPPGSTAVGYTNTRRLFDYLYGILLPAVSMTESDLPFDPALLPSGEAVSRYLSFGLSGLTVDDAGIRLRTDSDGYGPTSLFMYGVVAAAFAVPFDVWRNPLQRYPLCGRAQERIHRLLERYRRANGTYPPDLAAVIGGFTGWSAYCCPAARAGLAPGEAEDRRADEDYGYIVTWKKVKPPERFPDDGMVLWDSEPRHNGGRIVLLGDGTVTWMPEEAFRERLKEQDE